MAYVWTTSLRQTMLFVQQKLTPIEQIWLQTEKLNVVCLLHKDIFYELFKIADCELLNELFMKHNMAEYMIVMYYNKPLKECSSG